MGNRTTFTARIRSMGGDSRRLTTPAVTEVVVPFHIPDPTAANTTAVQRTSSNQGEVILPPNAIVTEITVNAAATGGSDPTFDMGWVGVDDTSAVDVDGLVAEGDADAGGTVYNIATATAGNDMNTVMSATQPVKITGGVGASAATGGSITGFIKYHVSDDGEQAN